MKNTVFYFFPNPAWLFVLVMGVWLIGCQSPDVAPTIALDETTTVSPTLVSVQGVAPDQAEVIVKTGVAFASTAWQLSIRAADGRVLTATEGQTQQLDLFNLVPYRVFGLITGQTYQLQFKTRNAGGDSVSVARTYTHRSDNAHWVRLTHAPLVGGDFAGSALSTDNLGGAGDADQLSVWRYVNEQNWQILTYYPQNERWYQSKELNAPSPRHELVRYRLQAVQGIIYDFNGIGYVTTELVPGQRLYFKDIGGKRPIVPYYAGPDGVTRWFTTLNRAYQLTEGGSSQVWVRVGTWDQYRTADLPEPTGTLATFRVDNIGYVVNQKPGQPIHLWAFDTGREQWSRKADFPGTARRQGIGFHAGDKGYFGLGINASEETLRDVWQYNPTKDSWQFIGDYPGAGSTYLTVGQMPGRTLLGWGYEQQPTAAGGIRLVGCTDFWEFKP